MMKRESPPAGNRMRRTERSMACPSITVPGGWGYRIQSEWGGGDMGVAHPVVTRKGNPIQS